MPDGSHIPQMQRVDGAAAIRLGPDGVERLAQRGSGKVMLPRVHGGRTEAVFLNTAGGLTGGDRLDYRLDLAGGAATGTTQTAERAYASAGGAACVDVALTAGPRADLAWLPQETILYEGSALDRRTAVDLADGASVIGCEMIVLGRRAMGERITGLHLTDRREVRRNGRPILIEPFGLTRETLAPSPVLLGGAAAIATLYVVRHGAEDLISILRETAQVDGLEAAASGWDGKAILRMRAADPAPLRAALARAAARLLPLPRVWPR